MDQTDLLGQRPLGLPLLPVGPLDQMAHSDLTAPAVHSGPLFQPQSAQSDPRAPSRPSALSVHCLRRQG
jgi:hypothetical protein